MGGAGATKTHRSALVVIPPLPLWPPIQAIRRRWDRQVGRWMPHVTLVYPFWWSDRFDEAEALVRGALAEVAPFEASLAGVHSFDHGRNHFTLWLVPEPLEAWRGLQAAIQHAVPDCDETTRHSNGFTPHLSVGQATSPAQLEERLAELRSAWTPLRFELEQVAFLHRTPDGPFLVERQLPLGRR